MPDVNYIDWHVHPVPGGSLAGGLAPGARPRARLRRHGPAYLTRNIDDPLHFRQVSVWDDHADFERYWYSDEIAALREEALNYYNKPLLPTWHTTTFDASPLPAVD